eukprot:scaffold74554_cov35-Prasinocladus_malaysianus.AAC.1
MKCKEIQNAARKSMSTIKAIDEANTLHACYHAGQGLRRFNKQKNSCVVGDGVALAVLHSYCDEYIDDRAIVACDALGGASFLASCGVDGAAPQGPRGAAAVRPGRRGLPEPLENRSRVRLLTV